MHRMRVLRPAENIVAFYDGRVEGYRFADGAELGGRRARSRSASRATRSSTATPRSSTTRMSRSSTRASSATALEARGRDASSRSSSATGTSITSPAPRRSPTARSSRPPHGRAARGAQRGDRGGHARGTAGDRPADPADPRLLRPRARSTSADLRVELIHADIHSDDATVIWLPEQRLLLCGDTMEDTVTYVDEPESFDVHLADLDRLARARAEPHPAQPRRSRT